jgi:hypothetical protein
VTIASSRTCRGQIPLRQDASQKNSNESCCIKRADTNANGQWFGGQITQMMHPPEAAVFKFAQFDNKAVTELKVKGLGRKERAGDALGRI